MRAPVRVLVSALVVVGLIVLSGCGSDDETSTAGGGAETDVTFRLDRDGTGGADADEVTLTCPGGDVDACAAIDALPADPTAATKPTQACTQVYGGPETLTINGTLRGEEVSAAFDRTNGCEIERVDRFGDVLAALYDGYRGATSVDVN
jgi:hypothetical protein